MPSALGEKQVAQAGYLAERFLFLFFFKWKVGFGEVETSF